MSDDFDDIFKAATSSIVDNDASFLNKEKKQFVSEHKEDVIGESREFSCCFRLEKGVICLESPLLKYSKFRNSEEERVFRAYLNNLSDMFLGNFHERTFTPSFISFPKVNSQKRLDNFKNAYFSMCKSFKSFVESKKIKEDGDNERY